MAGDLFEDLPPPVGASQSQSQFRFQTQQISISNTSQELSPEPPQVQPPPPPAPALKSALKRSKPPTVSDPSQAAPDKRLRFKTTTDASEKQVVEAMKKIASHIKNPSKFNKASKLAITVSGW